MTATENNRLRQYTSSNIKQSISQSKLDRLKHIELVRPALQVNVRGKSKQTAVSKCMLKWQFIRCRLKVAVGLHQLSERGAHYTNVNDLEGNSRSSLMVLLMSLLMFSSNCIQHLFAIILVYELKLHITANIRRSLRKQQ